MQDILPVKFSIVPRVCSMIISLPNPSASLLFGLTDATPEPTKRRKEEEEEEEEGKPGGPLLLLPLRSFRTFVFSQWGSLLPNTKRNSKTCHNPDLDPQNARTRCQFSFVTNP
jgi:hypothetical protein